MTRLTRDEQLEQLVKELNQASEGKAKPGLDAPPSVVPENNLLEGLLLDMAQREASDLLLITGNPPILRVAGRLVRTDNPPLDPTEVASLFGPFLRGYTRTRLEEEGAADFSVKLAASADDDERVSRRFRVNVHRQRGTLAASIRLLPRNTPTLSELNLPASLSELVKPTRGLVLICGPTGAGKTTTLAALIGEINRSEPRHVITIEDPIEFDHPNLKSVVEQVEIGRDARSFASALRASLRQNPDVILVGEMRDLETVSIALTAAETGHLILSTLHTSDASQAINRIVDVFPHEQQNQIRQQLAMSLTAIVCQQLLPRADNSGRAVAVEVLLVNHPVRNHIRLGNLQHLQNEITVGRRQGMISIEDSLTRLVRQGLVSLDEARNRSARPDEFESLMRG